MTLDNGHATHEVGNQPPPFEPRCLWASDAALREAVAREGGGWGESVLAGYGATMGGEGLALGIEANRDRPRLRTHDRYGHRIDTVDFSSAYHRLMQLGVEGGVAGGAWRWNRPGSHVVRAAMTFLHHQAEAGTNCPLTMTHAAVPVLRRDPALAEWAAKAIAPHYDPRDIPMADKAGVTLGMGMTEKQGKGVMKAMDAHI